MDWSTVAILGFVAVFVAAVVLIAMSLRAMSGKSARALPTYR
jgi:hypothetical protein